jgi:hypothetical protein
MAEVAVVTEVKPPIYIGIFLDDTDKASLLWFLTPLHPKIYGDHVTLLFKPNAEEVEAYQKHIGRKIPIYLLSEFADEKGQAVSVKVGMSTLPARHALSLPHITISCAEGVEPKYSKELLVSNEGFHQIPRMRMVGVIDFFPRTIKKLREE